MYDNSSEHRPLIQTLLQPGKEKLAYVGFYRYPFDTSQTRVIEKGIVYRFLASFIGKEIL